MQLDDEHQRPLRPGPQADRDGQDPDGADVDGRDVADDARRPYPEPPSRRHVAARPRPARTAARHRRTAVGPRALERPATTSSSSCGSRTSPTTSGPACERRVHGRLRPRRDAATDGEPAFISSERPDLEDGPRTRRPDHGHLAFDPDRGRRQPGQDARRDPPAGQPRVDHNGLYITEDPGSSQQFSAAQQVAMPPTRRPARMWQYKFGDASLGAVLKVDQSADEGPTDVDPPTTAGNWGAWETTGIVDVSAIFGPGQVPGERPGAHVVGREASRRQLDEQARGRSAPVGHHPGRLTLPAYDDRREAGPDGSRPHRFRADRGASRHQAAGSSTGTQQQVVEEHGRLESRRPAPHGPCLDHHRRIGVCTPGPDDVAPLGSCQRSCWRHRSPHPRPRPAHRPSISRSSA